jgi:hypothetical protein
MGSVKKVRKYRLSEQNSSIGWVICCVIWTYDFKRPSMAEITFSSEISSIHLGWPNSAQVYPGQGWHGNSMFIMELGFFVQGLQ